MKVYEVTIKKGYGDDVVVKTCAASSIKQAVDFSERFAKKNYYSNFEIKEVCFIRNVDIVYKS